MNDSEMPGRHNPRHGAQPDSAMRRVLEPDDLTPNEIETTSAPEDPADVFARWYEANHERVERIAKTVGLAPSTWLQQTLDMCADVDERLTNPRLPQTHRPRTDGIRDPQGRI